MDPPLDLPLRAELGRDRESRRFERDGTGRDKGRVEGRVKGRVEAGSGDGSRDDAQCLRADGAV